MGFARFLSLPVMVVLGVIGFVYHTVVVLVLQPWLSLSTSSGLANFGLLTLLCAMALLSYTLAVVRDPGYIPTSYLPDLEDEGVALHEVKRKVFPVPFLQGCHKLHCAKNFLVTLQIEKDDIKIGVADYFAN